MGERSMAIKSTRRKFIKSGGAALAMTAVGMPTFAIGQSAKIKIGVMMPFTGTFAQLGEAGYNALKLAINTNGGKLGGRDIEYISLDDESNPGRAPANAEKLIKESGVDVLYGTVHSGVAMGMIKIARETGTLLVIPNAGANAATGALCAPNVFRTSFASWQTAFPMAKLPTIKATATS